MASLQRRAAVAAPVRLVALVAAAGGAVAFAAFSGFGTRVRHASPLPELIDGALAASGFAINEISVTGHRQTPDSEVFRVLGAKGTTLLGLDVAAARRRIEALPWVETATLVRVLPDKLRIEIRERLAIAVWIRGDRKTPVDATGRELADLGNYVPPDLLRIAGDGAPKAAAALSKALAGTRDLVGRIRTARLVGERRWDLELINGGLVKLAAGEIRQSLERLEALQLKSRLLEAEARLIDLRRREAVVIGRAVAGDSAAAADAPARQRM